MINNLLYNSHLVSWVFEGKEVGINIENLFFASVDENNEYVYVNAGENYIKDKVYYFNFDGTLKMYYDLFTGSIKWDYKEEKQTLVIKDLIEIGYFPKKEIILVLFNEDKREVIGLNLAGEYLYEIEKPVGYRMMYFEEFPDNVAVVCDGGELQEDRFGRSRTNFLLNQDDGTLYKGNLAY
ncbi:MULTISPECIES: hypothetical protein [Psychrobacillus]|uniref:hypothetical protein n=1 Tax=Psychrobacillus TaxID=1221880 RepID=UPI0030F526F0